MRNEVRYSLNKRALFEVIGPDLQEVWTDKKTRPRQRNL